MKRQEHLSVSICPCLNITVAVEPQNVVVDEDASYDISAFDYDAAASLYGIPSSSKSFSSKQKRVSSNLRWV
eukprot:1161969-Pelagomonas_calceolata.AAC.10